MRILILLLGMTALAFAQLDNDTVSVSVSTSQPLAPPEQVAILVTFSSPPDSTIDDLLKLVQGLGIGASNLTDVGAWCGSNSMAWTFTKSLPFDGLKDIVTKLEAIRKSLADSFTLDYVLQAVPGAAPACPRDRLVADARSRAQAIAAAAGLRLGPIIALSDGTESLLGFSQGGVGFPGGGPYCTARGGIGLPSSAAFCGVTVQFKILR